MRFVWAVAAFVLAAILIGAGIAERTVFLGPKTEQTTISVDEPLPYTVVDGAVLTRLPGAQTVLAQADGEVYAAYGRTADMQAWLSDATYNHVTVADDGSIQTEVVEPTLVEEPTEAPAEGTEADASTDVGTTTEEDAAVGRNPAGSDLWLDEFTQTDRLIAKLQLPDTMSVLVAADGTLPAASTIQLSWPLDNSTPWAGPLIAGGILLMLLGVFLYVLGIRHARRSRGPRRKGLPPLAETQPISTIEGADEKGVISAGTPTTRKAVTARRAFAVVPAVAVSALLFAGCSADAWPQFDVSASPTPSEVAADAEGQQAPAVTETQAERILSRISQTVTDADAAADVDLATSRLAGAVLDERKANYLIRGKVADHAAPAAIPTTPLAVILPQAYDGWPRTVMLVVADPDADADADVSAEADPSATPDPDAPAAVTPTVVLMTQQDAWSEYKITYLSNLVSSTVFPEVAPATIGASQVPPDSSFLMLPPNEIAAAYADVLNQGDASDFADLFQVDGDAFRVKVAEDRATRLEEFNKTGAQTGSLTFSSAAGAYQPFALATLESGAIVAVSLTETDTVKPTNADAVIKLDGNPTVQALAGTANSATGFNTNFSDQLFFFVPNQAAGGQIQLLGYGSNILSAGVIK